MGLQAQPALQRLVVIGSLLLLFGCDSHESAAPPSQASQTTQVQTQAPQAQASQPQPTDRAANKPNPAQPDAFADLSPWTSADIDWRQAEGTDLSVLSAAHSGFPALQSLLPIFQQLTGIRVGYLMEEESDMRQKRQIDLSSGGGVYDVVAIGLTYLGEAHAGGWLEDLHPYLDNSRYTDRDWYQLDDMGSALLNLHIKDEHLLAMPYSSASPVFWYRKDLFNKYSITVPDSFEQIIPMKAKLQAAMDNDGLTDIYAFTTRAKIGAGRNTWTVIPTIRAYGGEMFDQQWRASFNSPEAAKALQVYRDMITGVGTPPDSEAIGLYEMRELFAQGKLASLIVATDFFNSINTPEKSPVWDKWDADLTPRGPTARVTSPWAWAWGINSSSQQKTAAWLFVQWATSEPTIQLLGTNITPARLSAWESTAILNLNAPGLIKAAKWALNNASPSRMQTGIPEFPEAGMVSSMAFSEIFYGAPIQQTLDSGVAKVNDIMAKGTTRGPNRD